jgi:hypothetical protein
MIFSLPRYEYAYRSALVSIAVVYFHLQRLCDFHESVCRMEASSPKQDFLTRNRCIVTLKLDALKVLHMSISAKLSSPLGSSFQPSHQQPITALAPHIITVFQSRIGTGSCIPNFSTRLRVSCFWPVRSGSESSESSEELSQSR